MIRKPDKEEFRESPLINGIRTVKQGATQGPKLLAKGVAWLYAGILLFAFLVSIVSGLGFGSIAVFFIGYVIYQSMNDKSPEQSWAFNAGAAPIPIPASRVKLLDQALPICDETTNSRIKSLRIKAVILALPALCFPLLIVPAVMVFGGTNVLKLLKKANKPLLEFSHRTIRINGPKGNEELDWDHVGLIEIKRFSRFNLNRLSKNGVRRLLIIHANDKRGILSSMPKSLSIPIGLLGLSPGEEGQLLDLLVMCRNAGGEVISDADCVRPAAGNFAMTSEPRHHVVSAFGKRAA